MRNAADLFFLKGSQREKGRRLFSLPLLANNLHAGPFTPYPVNVLLAHKSFLSLFPVQTVEPAGAHSANTKAMQPFLQPSSVSLDLTFWQSTPARVASSPFPALPEVLSFWTAYPTAQQTTREKKRFEI